MFELNADGTRVRQSSKEVCAGRVLRSFELNGVLNGDSEFRTGRQKKSQMIFGKPLTFSKIKGKHTRNAVPSAQWNRQCGLQHGHFHRVIEIFCFRRRLAVYDWLLGFGNPTGYALSQRNFKQPEKFEVDYMSIARRELFVAQYVKDDRIVRNHLFQANGNNGKRFSQTERIAHVLRKFKEKLCFLPGRDDGR